MKMHGLAGMVKMMHFNSLYNINAEGRTHSFTVVPSSKESMMGPPFLAGTS